MPEFTVKSILVGVLITIIMGSANAYLGLLVGMTVSATIPALVIGLAFMRPLKGTILETNMTKNIGVAGEALAAGIVFTFPALLIIYVVTDHQAGWATLGDHLPLVMLLSFVGGLLGVFFTIPLRRVFIEVEKLPYPEGVASGKVLITMYGGEQMLHYITFSMLIAGGMKFLSTSGLNLWREKLEYVLGRGKARLFGGLNISPALLGVGYIIGPRISGMVFAGGVLGWLVLIPLIGALVGWPTVDFQGNPITNPVDAVYAVWFQYTKWVGVGAVLTGGIWTLWTLRKTLMDSLRSSIKIGKEEGVGSTEELPRTERDMQVHVAYYVIIFVAMFIINYYVLKLFIATLVSTFVLFAAAFLFTAVAGYLAGIVGSSNNPISSVTISTLVITAAMLYLLQVNPSVGMPATILVAAIVCVSAAIAGDSMQELKTANMVGATPYDIQKGRIIGVLTASITIPAVVWMLESAYGIGVKTPGHPNPLPAPQAVIMGSTVVAIFKGDIEISMFILGVIIAIVLIRFKLPVMAVAIGIYLPFTLTTPIMLGGLIAYFSERFIEHRVRVVDARREMLSEDAIKERVKKLKSETFNYGLIFSAGLVAGEALMGVVNAIFKIGKINIALFTDAAGWPGLIAYLYLMYIIFYIVVRKPLQGMSKEEVRETLRRTFRRRL